MIDLSALSAELAHQLPALEQTSPATPSDPSLPIRSKERIAWASRSAIERAIDADVQRIDGFMLRRSPIPEATSPPPLPTMRVDEVLPVKPVLQINRFPQTLNPSDFANALSSSNPNGDLRSLYAFSELVNAIPSMTTYYGTQASTISEVYDLLLSGAQTTSTVAQSQFASARLAFQNSARAPMTGTVGAQWYAAYASPSDWYDVSQTDRFRTVTLNLSELRSSSSSYALIPSGESIPLKWSVKTQDAPLFTRPVTGKNLTVTFKGQTVRIDRQWMRELLFDLSGWTVPGEAEGLFSTGSLTGNDGLLPLLPTELLVGVDVEMSGGFSAAEQGFLDEAVRGSASVSFGPFAISARASADDGSTLTATRTGDNTVRSRALSVIGWISSLVPRSPASTQ